MPRFKVEVREIRSFLVDVLADDADNARFLVSKKVCALREHGTLPESQHVCDLPMVTWKVEEDEDS